MTENDLSEISLRDGSEEINLKRCSSNATPAMAGLPSITHPVPLPATALPPVGAHAAEPAPAETEADSAPDAQTGVTTDEGLAAIRSPMVGTFYSSPNPDAPPFVQVGSTVDADTVICIVEAMKVFNEIKAEVCGSIERIVVADQEPIEYGQELFLVRPSS